MEIKESGEIALDQYGYPAITRDMGKSLADVDPFYFLKFDRHDKTDDFSLKQIAEVLGENFVRNTPALALRLMLEDDKPLEPAENFLKSLPSEIAYQSEMRFLVTDKVNKLDLRSAGEKALKFLEEREESGYFQSEAKLLEAWVYWMKREGDNWERATELYDEVIGGETVFSSFARIEKSRCLQDKYTRGEKELTKSMGVEIEDVLAPVGFDLDKVKVDHKNLAKIAAGKRLSVLKAIGDKDRLVAVFLEILNYIYPDGEISKISRWREAFQDFEFHRPNERWENLVSQNILDVSEESIWHEDTVGKLAEEAFREALKQFSNGMVSLENLNH